MNKKGGVVLGFSLCVMIALAVFIVTSFNNQTCSMSVDPSWADEQKTQCNTTNFATDLIKKADDFRKNLFPIKQPSK